MVSEMAEVHRSDLASKQFDPEVAKHNCRRRYPNFLFFFFFFFFFFFVYSGYISLIIPSHNEVVEGI